MDSCHAGGGGFDGDGPLVLLVVDGFVLAGPTGGEDDESAGRPYFVYVQSCRIPRNAEKMRATVKINIPVVYVYGLVSADDDDGEAWDAESVVKTTPSVTINTDRIWVNEYLRPEISASKKENAEWVRETHLLFETSQPRRMLITNPPLLKMIWTGMGI
jgi:hypothetical protein